MNGVAVGAGKALWAITTYFNPVGYENRRANYRIFRERLTVPLLAIELGYGPKFNLGEGDADILVQLRGDDVMWQKERLLNLAMGLLPDGCDSVAWLDCDIVFEDDDWAERAVDILERVPLAQLFGQVHYMPRFLPPDGIGLEASEVRRTSLVSAVKSGLSAEACLEDANRRVYGLYSPGFAWAARRAFIEKYGLYDCCIVGGGDRAMAAALYDSFGHVVRRHRMAKSETARYLSWARRFHQAADGAVGFVEGNIFHLWHGALENRRMRERHQILSRFEFDPSEDIALDDNGIWRWNSDKKEMHAFVGNRFYDRHEDG